MEVPLRELSMADDSLDAPLVGSLGSPRYIDDEVDLEDDLDDEPLVGGSDAMDGPSVAASRSSHPGKSDVRSEASLEGMRQYALRAGGSTAREYVIARFLHKIPELDMATDMRMFRQGEGSVESRRKAIAADRKQRYYFNSFIGKRRVKRNEKQGLAAIPDRVRKPWDMEILFDRNALVENGAVPNGEAIAENHRYTGTFEGRNESRYAVMVMNDDSETVDVIPIGHLAWYGFRLHSTAAAASRASTVEEAEARMAARRKVGAPRLNKMQASYDIAQEKVELNLGGIAVPKKEEGMAPVGLHQRPKDEPEREGEEETREDFDYERDFDDDDVAQVDADDVDKTAQTRKDIPDRVTAARKFRRLIKDEPNVTPAGSRPGSPASDSEDDHGRDMSLATSSKRKARAAVEPAERSLKRMRVPEPVLAAAPEVAVQDPNVPSTFTHLLPGPNEDPTAKHVTDILRHVERLGKKITVKELVKAFGYVKQNPRRAMLRHVLKITAYAKKSTTDPNQSYLFLRKASSS